ncbi:hypothetical protein RR46_06482 [Papilio xuthus]|uniref:Uncharacterized protein n=1 Tax=Papilio xuthus TaxID=66420 RepID=A0A194QIP7_PAPXU|nr:hypothetical protein RR46_06482 [Papilio xuthus]
MEDGAGRQQWGGGAGARSGGAARAALTALSLATSAGRARTPRAEPNAIALCRPTDDSLASLYTPKFLIIKVQAAARKCASELVLIY